MSVLYVASDQHGAGKTAFCVTFARKLSSLGKKACVLKPVAETSEDADFAIYGELLSQESNAPVISTVTQGLGDGQVGEIKAAVEEASESSDVVVIEGASRLSKQDHARIAEAIGAKSVVVARYTRELSVADLKPWKRSLQGGFIGFIVNGLTRYLSTESTSNLIPSMEAEDLVNLGIIPEKRRLLSSSVAQISDHLGARYITGEDYNNRLVEHYMAWGFSLDPGELTFSLREDKALVIRGDRPDIQMSALATPTTCMIVTQGIEPIEYVRYEAEEEEVALMLVEESTINVMDSLGALMDNARFDHPEKVNAYSELLDAHLDYSTIFTSLGIKDLR